MRPSLQSMRFDNRDYNQPGSGSQRGPMQGGYSTNEKAADTVVKTSHIIAKLRATLKERLKIKTGMEKTKKDTKAINLLKEDRQAFGLLVGKITSLEEALSYPLTTV